MTTNDTTQRQDPPVRNPSPDHVLSELERLLRAPECPSCMYIEEVERSFFSWFEIESFSAAEMQSRLRAGMGMCPEHSRRLVEGIGGGHVMTIVVREALAGARQAARGEAQPVSCPACEAVNAGARRARELVGDGLLDPAIARMYFEHGGVCLPHFVEAAPVLEASRLKPMAEHLLESLEESEDSSLVALLGGADRDAPRRARWRAELPLQEAARSTTEGLCKRLGAEACPVCLSTALAERDYLRWFTERAIDNDTSLQNDPGELCPAHLNDLALANRPVAAQAIEHKRTTRMGKLRRLLARLGEPPAPSRRGRRNTVDELDRARAEFVSSPYCPACNARDGIDRSQLELVGAAIVLPAVRERYEHSHGLCLRHAVRLPDGQAGRLARRHVDGRLGVLAWEVHETARKYAWAYRHETGGPERDAWARALAQIDGRVFGGGPAPEHQP